MPSISNLVRFHPKNIDSTDFLVKMAYGYAKHRDSARKTNLEVRLSMGDGSAMSHKSVVV